MTKPDDDLARALRDPGNPRTPLQFKLLDRHEFAAEGLILRDGRSRFHRTTGFVCGAGSASPKPISKMFSDPTDG